MQQNSNITFVRICTATILAVVMTAAGPSLSEETGDHQHLARIKKRDNINEAVDKGLAYLVSQQDPIEGYFKSDKPNVTTALSCMALMAAGQLPGRSPYGDNLRRGIMYLAGQCIKENDGYLGKESNSRMYGHGICTLALCEAYGMMQKEEDNRRIREAIGLALKVILKAQVDEKGTHYGGWRYEPTSKDADLSVTVWQVLALRSAQNSRIDVPDQAIENAMQYVKQCFHDGEKGFSYQRNSNPSPAMRSAGVVCMLAMGRNKEENDITQINNSSNFLLTFDPRNGGHFFYQSYYVATAANMMGEKHRNALLPKLEDFLITLQQPNGEFRQHSGHQGGVYSTSFSIICLCVGYQYLPIYQE